MSPATVGTKFPHVGFLSRKRSPGTGRPRAREPSAAAEMGADDCEWTAARPQRHGPACHRPDASPARRQLARGTRRSENPLGSRQWLRVARKAHRHPPASPLAEARPWPEAALWASVCRAPRAQREPSPEPGPRCVPFCTSVCLTVKWTGQARPRILGRAGGRGVPSAPQGHMLLLPSRHCQVLFLKKKKKEMEIQANL